MTFKDSADFLDKTKNLSSIPENAILVTAVAVGLYPSMVHKAGLRALKKVLDKQGKKSICTVNLAKTAGFVLKNNFFEYISQIRQQVSGAAICMKFTQLICSCSSFHG